MAKEQKVTPTYMKGKRPMKIALHDIVRVVKMLDEQKHTEKFKKAAKSKKAFVKVDADTVNFVKDYMTKNDLHEHPIGKHIVNARGAGVMAGRFDCNFKKKE